MNRIKQVFGALILPLLFSYCTDQRDLYVKTGALVKVESDWSRSKINPDMWVIMLYNQYDGNPTILPTSELIDYIELAPEVYKTLIVNGSLHNGIDYVRFRGINNFETFEAYATEKGRKDDGRIIVNEPNMLSGIGFEKRTRNDGEYAMKYENGEKQNILAATKISDSIKYVPRPLVYTIHVKVIVESGIQYIHTSRTVVGELFGFSGGVKVGTRMPTHQAVINQITFPSIDRSETEGEFFTKFASFGPPLDILQPREYTAKILFPLRDGTYYMYTADIASQVSVIINKIRQWMSQDNGTDPYLEIVLRIHVPESGDDPGGLDPGIDDWEDVIIPLPI